MSPLFVYNPSIMATINVYEQYFEAECCFNGRDRHAALVRLISDSENKSIKYEVAVSFFPHDEPDDFAVSYDAYVSKRKQLYWKLFVKKPTNWLRPSMGKSFGNDLSEKQDLDKTRTIT